MPSENDRVPKLRRRNPYVVAGVLVVAALVTMKAVDGFRQSRWRQEDERARVAALLPRISAVNDADGLDAAEAATLAQLYLDVAYGRLEASVSEPRLENGTWRSVIRVGYSGTPNGDTITVDPRTGSITGPILGTFKSLSEFRRFLANGAHVDIARSGPI